MKILTKTQRQAKGYTYSDLCDARVMREFEINAARIKPGQRVEMDRQIFEECGRILEECSRIAGKGAGK